MHTLCGAVPCAAPPRALSDAAWLQVAKKIATAIFSDDLAEAIEHRAWHGRQPLTLTAATLFIALHLGARVMVPGLPPRTLQVRQRYYPLIALLPCDPALARLIGALLAPDNFKLLCTR